MNIIKLDAIDSTNTFLKQLCLEKEVDDYTVVTAKSQTHGKGQMGTKWQSETDKNLIMSILLKNTISNISLIFSLNIIITLSIVQSLQKLNIPNLAIKWPNDIMAGGKKIAGILIENSIKSSSTIDSVVGIGLNVNQITFENLPQASSLRLEMNQEYDIATILESIISFVKLNMFAYKNGQITQLWHEYEQNLFKKEKVSLFENANSERFMGIIKGVNSIGKIEILLDDDSVQYYGLKEIKMIF